MGLYSFPYLTAYDVYVDVLRYLINFMVVLSVFVACDRLSHVAKYLLYKLKAKRWGSPPPTPPSGEVPELGPYTIFAPTNAAFDEFLLLLGGGRTRIPLQAFIRLPELQDILLYHIYYGDYTTDVMFNNTGMISTLGSELVTMKDPRWTEGLIALNDACVDKPTTGYPCAEQLEFDKCYEPFMVSPLAAGWQGGFCQKNMQEMYLQ
eukprot:TRINITY_DN1522_c0_g1_i5.p2 TRINITY_DN1522_c0_g1~~TRINITY_DN1522_c0_g1_i5.p2  ORF type:complete len:206 (+),score=23.90 TRINITY_DN1522_c0_g1_i5:199-816(+)